MLRERAHSPLFSVDLGHTPRVDSPDNLPRLGQRFHIQVHVIAVLVLVPC